MSFIQEIVENIYENDSFDAKKNIGKLSTEIKKYQEQTKIYIDREYVDFLPNLTNNELYLKEGEKLLREAENLLQKIETETKQELYSANDELRLYKEELEEIASGLRSTHKILKIDDLFQLLEVAKTKKEFLVVMEIVGKIKALINDQNDKIFPKLLCYQNIKVKYHIEAEMLLHNLKQCFEQLVQFIEKPFQNTKSITLKISKNENQLNDIIIALFNAKYNPTKICDFLMTNVFEPIIMKPVSLDYNEDSNDEFFELLLSYGLRDLTETHLRPNYKTVFENITTVLTCLSYMNVQLSDSISVMSIFGEHMKTKLLDLLVNECLLFSIPKTMDEKKASTLVDDILCFNKLLVNCSVIIEDNDKELVKYAENIDVLFRNRFCSKILDESIEVMHKDLHDMILVAEKNTVAKIAVDPFLFQRCMVSRSTLELINLMKKVIEEAFVAEEEKFERLSTISSIIDQYMIEVPKHHEKMLNNIPQQTALFHNNCLYIAYWLNRCSERDTEEFHILSKSLQNLGTEHFMNQIKNQRSQLTEILREFDLTDVVSELGIGPQKIFRQCLRQLELLKNVWQTILPDIVYNKTMSNLLNDFCSEIVRKIMIIEDIPTAVSNELVDVITVIEERAPKLFQEKHQVLQIKSWMKLVQLKMILGASLIEITEQWSEGKGPLTLNYKPEELKHLIRALFQNTDRRANALASII